MAKKPKRQVVRAASEAATASVPESPSKTRVTLTLDPDLVVSGKQYGERHGISLSQLISGFLHALVAQSAVEPALREFPPAVRRLYGIAAGGDQDRTSYRAHLIEKHGPRE